MRNTAFVFVLIVVVFLLSAGTAPQASGEDSAPSQSEEVASSRPDKFCESEVCKAFENILYSNDRPTAMDAWLGSENLNIDELKTFMESKYEDFLTREEKKKLVKKYIELEKKKREYEGSDDMLVILDVLADLATKSNGKYDHLIALVEPSIQLVLLENSHMNRLGLYGQNQFDVSLNNTTTNNTEYEGDIIVLFDVLTAQVKREAVYMGHGYDSKVMVKHYNVTLNKKVMTKYYVIDLYNKKYRKGFSWRKVGSEHVLFRLYPKTERKEPMALQGDSTFGSKKIQLDAWDVIKDGNLDEKWAAFPLKEDGELDWETFEKDVEKSRREAITCLNPQTAECAEATALSPSLVRQARLGADDVNELMKGIVRINSDKRYGTGFYIDTSLVLSSLHVVASDPSFPYGGAEDSLYVELRNHDEEDFSGIVIGYDARRDLALIRAEKCGHPIPIYREDKKESLKLNDDLIAIGHPLEYEFVVTRGVVSFIGRPVPRPTPDLPVLHIQTDAAISKGNSGGPLIHDGEVVGVTAYTKLPPWQNQKLAIPQNLNFAVHYDEILAFLRQQRGSLAVQEFESSRCME